MGIECFLYLIENFYKFLNGLRILLKAMQIRYLLMLNKQFDRKKGYFVQEF